MWGALIQVGIWAGLYVANRLLRPKPQKPKPLTRDNLTLPRTEEGAPIPICFGRTRVNSPVLAWTGDLLSKTNEIGGGYVINYGVNMLFVVGIPMTATISQFSSLSPKTPRLYNVWYGDKKLPMVAPLPNSGGGSNNIRAQVVTRPEFHGGPGQGGGLTGTFEWYWGASDTDFNTPASPLGDVLTALAEGDAAMVPGYRNQMLVSFLNIYGDASNYELRQQEDGADNPGARPACWTIGESASVNGFSFEVGTYGNMDPTITTMLIPGYDFGGDADPVEVIFDVLTSQWSKIGLDPSLIDKPSFLAASTVLKAEGHGYSNVFYDSEDGVNIINDVLQQIDCAMYEEPTTGQMTLKLIRADYTPGSLMIFDETSIIEVEDYGIGGWKDLVNEVRVNYTDRNAEYITGCASAQSLANAAVNGNRRSVKVVDYPGCSNAALAAKLAARDLNVISRPLKKITLVLDRSAYALRPGSVFKVSYAEYNLVQVIFRAAKVDIGQLFDNKVVVEAIEDAFASTYVGMSQTWGQVLFPVPYPLVHQAITETPYWLSLMAKNVGVVNDEKVPRLISFAPPSINANRFALLSRGRPKDQHNPNAEKPSIGDDPITGVYFTDVPVTDFPTTFVVGSDYERYYEPYDTTIGLEIGHVEDPNRTQSEIEDDLTLVSTSVDAVRTGDNLICIITPDGEMEFMAFESAVTSDGGVTYTLQNVWRGLMDTPAIFIPAGSRGFFVSPALVGRRGYPKDKTVDFQMVPHAPLIGGSGGDPTDTLVVRARPWLPMPMHDLSASAARQELLVQGMPASTGYKVIGTPSSGYAEEDIVLYGRLRQRTASVLSRGDYPDEANQDFSTQAYYPFAYPDPDSYPYQDALTDHAGYGLAYTYLNALNPGLGTLVTGVLIDGYGVVKLSVRTKRVIQVGDPAIGQAGIVVGDVLVNWDAPSVDLWMPEWRNILGNVRFTAAGGFTPWWAATNGSVTSGTFGITRNVGSTYMRPSSTTAALVQKAAVAQWLPRGLCAIAWGYFRNASSDTNDTATLTVSARDSSGASLLSGSNAATPAVIETNWRRRQVAISPLPAGTAEIWFATSHAEVAGGGGTANADSCFTEAGLSIGQIASQTLDLLTNSSFDSGSTASWTNATGSMVAATTISSPSDFYAQGGAFATSEIYQEFTLPAGYEAGTYAVARFWRAQTIAGDTGTVKLEVMNAASSVLASRTTGAEDLATLNEWTDRVLNVEVPDGATKVRITLTAVRTGGAGNSGACFDEVRLSLHKKLAPTYDYILDFRTAAQTQEQPATWQEYAVKFPRVEFPLAFDHDPPAYVFAGTSLGQGRPVSGQSGAVLEWSDGIQHNVGKMVGAWGEGADEPYVDSFQFTRQSGGSAVCVEAQDQAIDWLAAYNSTAAFSVIVFFRVDELPWTGVGCGIVGRRDLTAGWAIEITAAGTIQVVFEGTSGTKTATVAGVVNDGAVHMAGFTYDPIAQQIIAYNERGAGAPVSTAAGLGEFGRTASTCRFRIGKSSSSIDTIPGMVSRVFVFGEKLSAASVADHWSYLDPPAAPSGTFAYSRNVVAWGEVGEDSDGNSRVCAFSTDQWAFGRGMPDLAPGLLLAGANTNLITSWNFANAAAWTVDAGASVVQGVEDNTGRLAGVTVTATTTNGLRAIALPGTATTTLQLVFWARADISSGVSLELTNASNVVKNTQAITVNTTWTRHVVSFTSWDNSTPTMRVRWRSTAGTVTFTLAHVVWAQQGQSKPVLYPGPSSTLNDVTVTWTNTFPRQFNSEGEIVIVGHMIKSAPASTASLVTLRNTTNDQNRRELLGNASAQAVLNHYNGTAVNVVSTGTAFDWTLEDANDPTVLGWRLRGRWNRAMLLDNAANPYAGIVSDCDASSVAYGRTATFTESSTVSTVVEINKGTSPGTDMVVQYVNVRSRELKAITGPAA